MNNFDELLWMLYAAAAPGAGELREFIKSAKKQFCVNTTAEVVDCLTKRCHRQSFKGQHATPTTRLELLRQYRETGKLPRPRQRRRRGNMADKVMDVKRILALD